MLVEKIYYETINRLNETVNDAWLNEAIYDTLNFNNDIKEGSNLSALEIYELLANLKFEIEATYGDDYEDKLYAIALEAIVITMNNYN